MKFILQMLLLITKQHLKDEFPFHFVVNFSNNISIFIGKDILLEKLTTKWKGPSWR